MGRQGAVVNTPTSLPMTPPAHFQGVSAMDTMPDLFDFLTPTTVPPATQPDHVPAEQHDFRPPTPIPHPTPVIEPAPLTSTPVIPEDWDLFSDKPAPVTVAPLPGPLPVAEVSAPPVPQTSVPIEPAPLCEPPAAIVERPVNPVSSADTAQPDLLQAFLRGAGPVSYTHLTLPTSDLV